MIIDTVDISDRQTAEINNLVALCEKHDNAEMCIQMDHSLNYFKDMKSWVLYYSKKELVGIASIFSPMADEAEISFCVKPENRRKGISDKLLEIAYGNVREFDIDTILYVCDRASKTGAEILKKRYCSVHHTEYTMKYARRRQTNDNQRITVKKVEEKETEAIAHIIMDVFDSTPESAEKFIRSNINSPTRSGYTAVKDEKIIGIAFVGYNEAISINTLGIVKEEQHKGYGREFLKQIINRIDCPDKDIVIDVDSDNINAYKLYKSTGFEEILTIDYYRLVIIDG
jgi:ribosomal protein S18 acetylase RimI-like enzyme